MNNKKECLYLIHGGPGLNDSYFYPFLDNISPNIVTHSYVIGESIKEDFNILSLKNELFKNLLRLSKSFSSIMLLAHSFGSALVIETLKEIDPSNLNISSIIYSNWIIDNKWITDFNKKNINESFVDYKDFKKNTIQFLKYYFHDPDIGKSILKNIQYRDIIFNSLQKYIYELNLWSDIKKISVPQISISSTHDLITSNRYITENAKRLKIKNYEICDAGHFPFIEKNAVFKKIILEVYNEFNIKKKNNSYTLVLLIFILSITSVVISDETKNF